MKRNSLFLIGLVALAVILTLTSYPAIQDKSQFYATLLAVWLGSISAFITYKISVYDDSKTKLQIERENTRYCYELYGMEIRRNEGHMDNIINKRWLPFYRLQTITRDKLWGELADYSKDINLMGKLNHLYGEYSLINNKIDIANAVNISSKCATDEIIKQQLKNEITDQLTGCQKLCVTAKSLAGECLKIIDKHIESITNNNGNRYVKNWRVRMCWIWWLALIVVTAIEGWLDIDNGIILSITALSLLGYALIQFNEATKKDQKSISRFFRIVLLLCVISGVTCYQSMERIRPEITMTEVFWESSMNINYSEGNKGNLYFKTKRDIIRPINLKIKDSYSNLAYQTDYNIYDKTTVFVNYEFGEKDITNKEMAFRGLVFSYETRAFWWENDYKEYVKKKQKKIKSSNRDENYKYNPGKLVGALK